MGVGAAVGTTEGRGVVATVPLEAVLLAATGPAVVAAVGTGVGAFVGLGVGAGVGGAVKHAWLKDGPARCVGVCELHW